MDWSFPYRSQRMPVCAPAVVATGQPLAAQAGLHALRDGGTAADAAICAAITLTVVEPVANGIGSDAFALCWNGSLQGWNSSGRSPAGQPLTAFDGLTTMPRTGWPAVTVPGCVALWAALHQSAGRLPFERLFQPAIHYAEEGYPVSPMTAASWARSVEKYKAFPAWMATFAPEGRAPAPGQVVRLPDHARTLREIAATRGESFYRGKLAQQIEAAARADGAALRASDLAAHHAEPAEPWSVGYRGVDVHELPPNGQGVAALITLAILANLDFSRVKPDSTDWVHLQVEAMKAAFVDTHARVADPAAGTDAAHALLDPAFLKGRAQRIRADRAQAWEPTPLPGSSTVYLCAADSEGHMVSYIQSNYEGFGSGVVVPGTGIALQNRGACFSLQAGHPNQYAPGKRPFHTIIPAFLTRNGAPLAALGVMGGAMQPQGHMQVVMRLVDQQLNPQSALDAPRWQIMDDGTLALEPGFPAQTVSELAARGHTVRVVTDSSVFFGGGQLAWRDGSIYLAGSDPRRDGQAVGM